MSLASNVTSLATRIATEIKALRTMVNGNSADLSALTTTAKGNLVAAINEVKASVASAAGIADGSTSTSTTWSSSKISTDLSGKAAATHSHAIGDLPVATSGTSSNTQLVRADDSRLSNSRTPTAHVHAIADTTGLQTALDGKAAASHTHTSANISDFNAAADARIANWVGAAPTALDTLDELAAALGDDPNFATTMTTALANRVRVDAVQSFTGPQQVQARSNIGAASAADLTTLTTNVGDTTTNFVTAFEAGLV